jgi:carboxymethylenebutenolidase
MVGHDRRYSTFRPPGQVRGGVVVCHEVWGVTAPLLSTARALADAGFLVTVPDFYARVDGWDGPATSYRQASRSRASLDVTWLREVLDGATGWLRSEGAERTGVLGYSMGGAVALWAATVLDIDAAVTFYGGGLLEPYWPDMPPGVVLAGQLSARWLGFYGGRDPLTPPEALRRLRVALDDGNGAAVVFDGLDHGFALDPADPRHAPEEAAVAWRDTLSFLDASA